MDDLDDYSDKDNKITHAPGILRICKTCEEAVEFFPGMGAIVRLIKESELMFDALTKISNSSYKWPRGVSEDVLEEVRKLRLKAWDNL
jgi:hypothetical protein